MPIQIRTSLDPDSVTLSLISLQFTGDPDSVITFERIQSYNLLITRFLDPVSVIVIMLIQLELKLF
jgi:hypothetical protein